MDMGTGKTDELIAAAIAGLPYRRPSAGFKARVIAAVAAQAAADARLGWAVKAVGLLTAGWTALVATLAAGPAYAFAKYYGSMALEPGGAAQALRLLAARMALAAGKLYAALHAAGDVAGLAAGALPAPYEVAAAALISAVLIAAVTRHRGAAAQRI